MSRDEGMRQLRAGLFLTGSVGVLVLALVLIGRSQTLFADRIRLHTEFENTSGLVIGAPVRLAGVDVGVVQAIRFDADPRRKQVKVTLGVDRRFADRVRADSVARLSSKGLLGDVLVDISVGSAEAAALADGGHLQAQEHEGLPEIVDSMKATIDEVRTLSGTVGKRLDAVFTDQLGRDVERLAHAAADVAEEVRGGQGLAHAVVYDRRMAGDAKGMVADARATAQKALGSVDRLDALLAEVQDGDGSLHGLVYRDDARRMLNDLDGVAKELGGVVEQIRSGHGLLHTLVYEQDGELIANLTAISRTLRQVGDDVRQGKGTVGGLLKDPTVYEDLKGIVGSVQRSRILRWLIRNEIKQGGLGSH